MHILHYSLGLPPFRRGGMTKYCDDLMIEQQKIGNQVSLLYPGTLHNRSKKCSIISHRNFTIDGVKLDKLLELKNPMPVPLIDGIKDLNLFEYTKDIKVFNNFFEKNKFDVFHIHTMMGLPFELVISAKEHGIKVIFTSHDYFPICPKVFLFHDGVNCISDRLCKDCVNCNKNALSFRKMMLLQSKTYQKLKHTYFIKKLRSLHNAKTYSMTFEKEDIKGLAVDNNLPLKYLEFRKRNISLLNKIDKVHFNSNNTLNIYEKYGKTKNNIVVLSISSGSISDRKKLKKINGIIQLGYLGPAVNHKGMDLLLLACDDIWNDNGRDFHLHIYVNEKLERPYITNHGMYEYVDLPNVMNQIDLLIVPSICNETFGFTVLEAHSFGVPAIVSNCVGAKDLIESDKNGAVFKPEKDDLKKLLIRLLDNPSIIEGYSQWIYDNEKIKSMYEHAQEILKVYKDL